MRALGHSTFVVCGHGGGYTEMYKELGDGSSTS